MKEFFVTERIEPRTEDAEQNPVCSVLSVSELRILCDACLGRSSVMYAG